MTPSLQGHPGLTWAAGLDSPALSHAKPRLQGGLARVAGAPEADLGTGLDQTRLPREAKAIRETAIEFEAMFLGEMFRHMWAGIEVDPMFGGGSGERMFRGMLIDAMSREVAGSRGIGIADMVERELLRIQEASS